MITEHHKTLLDRQGKALYDKMVAAFSGGMDTVKCGSVPAQIISDAYTAVLYDHAELFYLSPYPEIAQSVFFGAGECTLTSRKIFSRQEIRDYSAVIEDIKRKLLLTANRFSREDEKEKVVCDYIIEHTVYELDNTYNQNAATVLAEGKGQCSGIAAAVKLLLNHLNIPCLLVSGQSIDSKGKNPHAWNIVKVNGAYYHLDTTFMLGSNPSKAKPYWYFYFNYSDKKIFKDHIWKISDYPRCITERAANTSIGGAVVKSLYEFRQLLKKELAGGAESVEAVLEINNLSQQELIKLTQTAVRDVINGLDMRLVVSCKFADNVVRVVREDK